ncbi:PQQ-binding-like beta-propeller repeat protein [Ktedonobacter racemifer]|uniref:Pyrrolo-quinoline quinone n=1 Tax=Ktedonobacter racemifer DSM 44963 TaxID=485913 RepID=D6U4H4_KTERA|nr:PQQ-binding-like beta-propeller repeat protein [Ktedonobacter racemifer]EFH81404.1 Pyrrolo-quinoline quinone [Ktedonobacter racemifer DSM 44963]
MAKHEDSMHTNDFYVPEQVDEQLEAILHTGQASPRDLRLLEGLLSELSMQQEQASATDEAGQRVLTRVYFRLQHMEEMQRLKERHASPSAYPERTLEKRGSARMKDVLINTGPENNDALPPGQARQHNQAGAPSKRRGRNLFALLAAVVLIGIVVGSFAIFAQLNHAQPGNLLGNQQKPTKATATAAVALPSSLYVTQGNAIIKLDKHSGKVLWTFHIPGVPGIQSFRYDTFTTLPGLSINTDTTIYFFYSLPQVSSKNINGFVSHVYAIDARDGHQSWSYAQQGDLMRGQPVVSGKILYMALNTGATVERSNGSEQITMGTGGYLLALDAQTGRTLWRTPLKGATDGNLTVANDLVHVNVAQFKENGGSIRGIQAIHAQNGAPAWWASTENGTAQSRPLVTQSFVYTFTQEIANNQNTSYVNAFDAQTGTSRWKSAPISDVSISGVTPIMANNKIYFCASFGGEATMVGKIFALDPLTGRQLEVHGLPLELYKMRFADGHIYISYATHNGTSIDTYGNSGLLALDMATYKQLWIYQRQFFPYDYLSDNSVLYVAVQNQVEAVNPNTGKSIWLQDITSELHPN